MSDNRDTLIGEVLVPGGVAVGRVATDPTPGDNGYFWLTGRMSTDDVERAAGSLGVIVEAGCGCDHAVLISRVRGTMVIRLPGALKQLRDGQRICVDGGAGHIITSPPFPEPREQVAAFDESTWSQLWPIRFQVAIFDEHCVRTVNKLRPAHVEQFFLRHELICLKHHECPFGSVQKCGIEGASAIIQGALRQTVDSLKEGQILNFRSLDVRSDEYHFIKDPDRAAERNADLALHGIRHLLLRRELLKAELLAVDALRADGYENVFFSLPFLIDPSEFDEVQQIASNVCTTELPIGVFVETPAAVYKCGALLQRKPCFLCVGTKDLAQLMLGAGRTEPNVQHLYNLTDSAVLQAASNVVTECVSGSVPAYVYADLQNIEAFLRIPRLNRLSVTRGDYQAIAAGLNQRDAGRPVR